MAGLLVPVGRAAAADARTLALRSVHTGEFVRATNFVHVDVGRVRYW